LFIGAKQDREVPRFPSAFFEPLANRKNCFLGFHRLVGILSDPRAIATGSSGPQDFVVTDFIEFNQRVGHLNDRGGRAVVVFQPNNFRIRPIFTKRENVLHFRSTPTVDGLIIIANHAQISVFTGQGFDDPVLALIRILIFVNQQMVKLTGFFGPDRFVLFE
jgi:hypothetical protein